MAGSQYQKLPEDEDNDEEKPGLAQNHVLSCKERNERFWKTVFAAGFFTFVCAVTLLALSMAIPDEPEQGVLSIRQALIPQSQLSKNSNVICGVRWSIPAIQLAMLMSNNNQYLWRL